MPDIKKTKPPKKQKPSAFKGKGNKEWYHLLFNNVSDAVFVHWGPEETKLPGKFIEVNDVACQRLGYTREEFLQMRPPDIDAPETISNIPTIMETLLSDQQALWEGVHISKDGRRIPVEIYNRLFDHEGKQLILSTVRDITERKMAENTIQKSISLLSAMLESTEDGILVVDQPGRVTKFNQKFLTLWHIPESMAASGDDSVLLAFVIDQLKDPDAFLEGVRKLYSHPDMVSFDNIEFNDGRIFERYSQPQKIGEEIIGRVWSFRDVTERKKAEETLRRSEEKFRFLAENMNDNIFTMDLNLRTTYVSPSIKKILGFTPEERMKQDITEQVTPASMARIMALMSEELEREQRGLGDPDRTLKVEVEYYHKDGSTVWVENVISGIRDDQGTIIGIHGVSRDITERRQAEHALEKSVERLRRSLGATVQAMAMTVETRDPYTAGHQRRVSDLARAIATEMGLTADKIDGVRMAASIHDIGKISVPAEILSKPTKLTDIEFSLIKTHSLSGYDILKDIEFPWPIARMILEHHERMDSSGYPNGLKEEEILLESRILAVADVVESMASHRPYRPALGVNIAMDEIIKNKGILYDPQVVDACVKLFQEERYALPA